jgi:hypothetical protein
MSSRAISSAKNRRTTNLNLQQPTPALGVQENNANLNQIKPQPNKELSVREAFSLMDIRIKNLENMSTQNVPNDFSFIENEFVKKDEFNNLLSNLKKQFSEINKLNLNDTDKVESQNSSVDWEDIKNNNNILSSKIQNTSQLMNVKYENLQNSMNEIQQRINSLDDMSKSFYTVQTSLQDTILCLQNDIIKSNLLLQQKLLHSDEDDESIIINENINIIPDTENMTIDLVDNLNELINFGINGDFSLNAHEGIDGMEEVELDLEQLFDEDIQEIDGDEIIEEVVEEVVNKTIEDEIIEEVVEEENVDKEVYEEEEVVEEENVDKEVYEEKVVVGEEAVDEETIEEEEMPPPPPSSD